MRITKCKKALLRFCKEWVACKAVDEQGFLKETFTVVLHIKCPLTHKVTKLSTAVRLWKSSCYVALVTLPCLFTKTLKIGQGYFLLYDQEGNLLCKEFLTVSPKPKHSIKYCC